MRVKILSSCERKNTLQNVRCYSSELAEALVSMDFRNLSDIQLLEVEKALYTIKETCID